MKPIPAHIRHPKTAYWLTLSMMLERAAYYGVRALIFIYLGGTSNALEATGQYISWFLTADLVGGLLGDFLLGRRQAIFIGGLLEAIGIGYLLVGTQTGIDPSIGFIAIGTGLFRPNLFAYFSQYYYDRAVLMDAAYSVLMIGINIGALIGTSLLVLLGEINILLGFGAAGICSISSIMIFSLSRKMKPMQIQIDYSTISRNIIYVLVAGLGLVCFFLVNHVQGLEPISRKLNDITTRFFSLEQIAPGVPLFNMLLAFLSLIVLIILARLWTKYRLNSFSKLAFGLLAAFLAFVSMILLSEESPFHHIYSLGLLALCSLILITACIKPIVYSIIATYCPPKYLATAFSLLILPHIVGSFMYEIMGVSILDLAFFYSLIVPALLIAGLALLILVKRLYFSAPPIFASPEFDDKIDQIGKK